MTHEPLPPIPAVRRPAWCVFYQGEMTTGRLEFVRRDGHTISEVYLEHATDAPAIAAAANLPLRLMGTAPWQRALLEEVGRDYGATVVPEPAS